jgi:predicted phosphodiesterase
MRHRILVMFFLSLTSLALMSILPFTLFAGQSQLSSHNHSGVAVLYAMPYPSKEETPTDFKMAFIGDQGLGAKPEKVLALIKKEGAQAVLHLGDFDYTNNPAAWEKQINKVLGRDFPYFSVIGNHDLEKWDGDQGYQKLIQQRFTQLGVAWDGDLGVQSSFTYKGIFFVLLGAGTKNKNESHHNYVKRQLDGDHSIWSIAAWHKNQKLMQVGEKSDEAGWEVYEAAREGGAIVATGHEHSYSRTHLLSNMKEQTVVGSSETLTIEKGKSFVFVSGLGGASEREQKIDGSHWAAISAKKCLLADTVCQPEAAPGALFGTFNVDGQPNRATFYFKDIKGRVRDRFTVLSQVEP